jgi:hypothetical protein
LTFRKPGPAPSAAYTTLNYGEWVEYSRGVWYIPGAEAMRDLAVFPEELVSRFIEMYSCKGDFVLDPFLGTGTTVAVARALGRRGIGYEINPGLSSLIGARLQQKCLRDRGRDFSLTLSAQKRRESWITSPVCDPNLRFSAARGKKARDSDTQRSDSCVLVD